MMDEYYIQNNSQGLNSKSRGETPLQLRKQSKFKNDYEDEEDSEVDQSVSKLKPPKKSTNYKSDKESTSAAAQGSKLLATDNEGMPMVGSSSKYDNFRKTQTKSFLPPIKNERRNQKELFEEMEYVQEYTKHQAKVLNDDEDQPKSSNKFFNLPA